jgi:hypothetical protein
MSGERFREGNFVVHRTTTSTPRGEEVTRDDYEYDPRSPYESALPAEQPCGTAEGCTTLNALRTTGSPTTDLIAFACSAVAPIIAITDADKGNSHCEALNYTETNVQAPGGEA